MGLCVARGVGAHQRLVEFDGMGDVLDVVGINCDDIDAPIDVTEVVNEQVLLGCVDNALDFALVD